MYKKSKNAPAVCRGGGDCQVEFAISAAYFLCLTVIPSAA